MTEVVRLLLNKGARPDVRNNLGYTALMISSSQGHANVVGELLKAGADRTLRNKKHERAIDIATAAGHAEITQLLK
jgi:ankyrin repeat protein